MIEYHKINTIFKRDMENSKKLIIGDWSLPEFEYLANNEWEFTEKVDGTNIRLGFERMEDSLFPEIGGRTNNAVIPKDLHNTLKGLVTKVRNDVGRLMVERDIDRIIFFGEGYGPKINGGGKYRDDPDFVLFDVRVGDWWLRREDVVRLGESLGMHVVPLKGYGTLWDAIDLVRNGMESRWGHFEAEGIVARPKVSLFDRAGNRIITKIKGRDFR